MSTKLLTCRYYNVPIFHCHLQTSVDATEVARHSEASKSTFSYCSNTPKTGVWTKFRPFENSEISSCNAKFTKVEASSAFIGHTNAINVNG